RIDVGPHHRVELLSAASREDEAAVGDDAHRRHDDVETSASVDGWEHAVGAEVPSSDLDRVSCVLQTFDARVRGHYACDLRADGLRRLAAQLPGAIGARQARNVGEDAPLAPSLAHPPPPHLPTAR